VSSGTSDIVWCYWRCRVFVPPLQHRLIHTDTIIYHHVSKIWAGNTETKTHSAKYILAVSEHGYDAVAGKRIHHKNGIPWDNRPENIEPLTRTEHQGKHKKAQGKERKSIAYAYEFTDMSSYAVAETCDYTPNSVMRIHKEYFD